MLTIFIQMGGVLVLGVKPEIQFRFEKGIVKIPIFATKQINFKPKFC